MTASTATKSARTSAQPRKAIGAKRAVVSKNTNAKPAAPKSPLVKDTRATPPKVTKTAAPVKATAPATKTPGKNAKVVTAPAAKEKKVKVVRDSFTIPKNEFGQLGDMKKKALGLGTEVKKSELIRAGLLLLNSLSDAAFKSALSKVPTLKTGRPGKG